MAYVAILVVDDTELSGGDSLYGLVCLNNVAVWRAVIACDACYRGFEKLRGMTVFESYRFVVTVAAFPWVAGYEQRFRQMDAVAILLLGVISTGHIHGVVADILFYHIPRASAQAKPLALSDGVIPISVVFAYFPASLNLDYGPFAFSEMAA